MTNHRSHVLFIGPWLAAAGCTLGACAPAKPPAGSAQPPASVSAAAPVSPDASTTTSASAPPMPLQPPSAAFVAPTPVPTSSFASTKTESSWATCHQSYKATAKDVSKDVAAMAAACEKQTKMKLVGKTLTGKQADQEKPQSFPFDAKAKHCYRVYAQAEDGIKNLDLVVKDSAGIVVGQDSTDDPSPVVLEDGAACFSKDDKASVVVSVGMGSGAYAVQIWAD